MHIHLFLLHANPIYDSLLTQLCLQHIANHLEVIHDICFMSIAFGLQLHQYAHLFILRAIHHHEGFGHFAFIQGIDLTSYLRWQLLVFKFTCTGIHVCHQTATHHRILILRELRHSSLKWHTAIHHQYSNRIQLSNRLHLIIYRYARAQQDMTTIHALAFFLNQLDDMIAILCLHNARYAFGVIHVECYICKFAHQLTFTHKAQLSTSLSRLRILRI